MNLQALVNFCEFINVPSHVIAIVKQQFPAYAQNPAFLSINENNMEAFALNHLDASDEEKAETLNLLMALTSEPHILMESLAGLLSAEKAAQQVVTPSVKRVKLSPSNETTITNNNNNSDVSNNNGRKTRQSSTGVFNQLALHQAKKTTVPRRGVQFNEQLEVRVYEVDHQRAFRHTEWNSTTAALYADNDLVRIKTLENIEIYVNNLKVLSFNSRQAFLNMHGTGGDNITLADKIFGEDNDSNNMTSNADAYFNAAAEAVRVKGIFATETVMANNTKVLAVLRFNEKVDTFAGQYRTQAQRLRDPQQYISALGALHEELNVLAEAFGYRAKNNARSASKVK